MATAGSARVLRATLSSIYTGATPMERDAAGAITSERDGFFRLDARRARRLPAGLELSGAREIVVVPMLVSSHSGHYDQIRYLTGSAEDYAAWMANLRRVADTVRARTGLCGTTPPRRCGRRRLPGSES